MGRSLLHCLWDDTRARVREVTQRRSIRAFSHVLTGNMLVSASQAIQFMLLARVLGPSEFGQIAAVASVAAVLMPFSGMGAANVMVMRAARKPGLLQTYFGNALMNAILTGSLLTAFSTLVITPLLGPQASYATMLVFCSSELVFSKLTDVCSHVFVANERLHWSSLFLVFQSSSRLVAVLGFTVSHASLASSWIWWAVGSNAAVGAWTVLTTARQIGRPLVDLSLARREFWVGVPFAVGLSAKGFYTDADKVFLARYGSSGSVGMYTVAFRVAQMALVPIRAVSSAMQARYFRAGETGVGGSLAVATRLARSVIPMAALIGLGSYAIAPLITLIAGPRYAESVTILRWLAGLPILLAAQSLLGDALSGGGNQRAAAAIQVLSAVMTCALCLLLIPRMDWRGAVAASYLSQLALIAALLCAILVLRWQTKPALE